MTALAYPLQVNTIRRASVHNAFGMVRNGGHRAHQGWDLLATPLTPCYAISNGRIFFTGNRRGYGQMVVLEFDLQGHTYYAAYCHLSFIQVPKFSKVLRGDLVGRTGNSGNAGSMHGADQHLHFEIRTVPFPGEGLVGRIDPARLYRTTPLHYTTYEAHGEKLAEISTRPGLKAPGINVLD